MIIIGSHEWIGSGHSGPLLSLAFAPLRFLKAPRLAGSGEQTVKIGLMILLANARETTASEQQGK